jgi:hypothetical protein
VRMVPHSIHRHGRCLRYRLGTMVAEQGLIS